MSTRESVGPLRDLYGIDLSPDLISAVTEAVAEQVAAWQARPLRRGHPPSRALWPMPRRRSWPSS